MKREKEINSQVFLECAYLTTFNNFPVFVLS